MSKFIKTEVKQIEISGIRTFNALASEVKDVIKLTIGELDIPTPEYVKHEAIKAINENKTTYTTNKGIIELRKKISQKYYGLFNPEEVILTVGTTEGLALIIQSVLGERDEIIIPTPGYVGYEPLVTLEKGIVVQVNTTKYNNEVTRDALDLALSYHTKCLLVTNPNNPTGHVLSEKEMTLIKDFVLENDILLISDEIYSDITFDKPFTSFASFKELRHNLILLDGFSKSHAMTGFRIGYLAANNKIVDHLIKVHQYNVTATSTISQYAALHAIDFKYSEMVSTLKHRRDIVLRKLDELELPYIKPEGAFYVFIDISKYQLSSLDFCKKLLYDYKVALIPGEYFLGKHRNYVRLSYSVETTQLELALSRLEAFEKANQ